MTFLKPYKGVRNIWVKNVAEPFSAARPISADAKRPIGGYSWSRDSKYVLYAQDNGGDENFNVYAVDPKAPVDAATGVPPVRNLTNLSSVRAMLYAAPKSKPAAKKITTPLMVVQGKNDPRVKPAEAQRL